MYQTNVALCTLWLNAEHGAACSCAKSACTQFLGYKCPADHANPMEIPSCCGDRPSARNLIGALSYAGKIRDRARGIANILAVDASQVAYLCPHYDACGMLARDLHYNCNICFAGDFDFGPKGVAQKAFSGWCRKVLSNRT